MRIPIKIATALIAVIAVMAALGIGSADAAPAAVKSDITLNGQGPSQNQGGLLVHCDTCAPDILFACGGCEVTVGGFAEVNTQVAWTAPASINTTYDSDQLQQGATVALSNALTPGKGTITIKYNVPWIVGLFGKGGDFAGCDDVAGGWCQSTSTLKGKENLQTSASCTPPLTGKPNTTCTKTDTIPIVTSPKFLDFAVGLSLVINHTFTIGPNGITSHRVVAGLEKDLTFVNPVPSVVNDPFQVACGTEAGSSLKYQLTDIQYHPSVNVTGSIGLGLHIQIPLLPDFDDTFELISGKVYNTGDLAMEAKDPEPSILLGTVSKDKVQPVVNSVSVPASVLAGKAATFSADATDNCKGPSDLHYKWSFSDGGSAFGQSTTHTFEKAGTYSGEVRVYDNAGNEGAKDFSVTVAENRTTAIKYDGPISIEPQSTDKIEMAGTLLSYTGNPIAGRTLTFAIEDAAGASVLGPVSNTTDVNGVARASFRPNEPLAEGSYQVVVSFAGDATYDATQFSKKFSVFANRPPDVSALPTPAKVVWGKPVEFSGFATDPDGSSQDTLKYAWDFGDGNGAINQKVDHAYDKPGTYEVTLTVTDKNGESTSVSTTVTVNKRETFLKQCGDVQVASGQRTVNECAILLDVQGEPVIGRGVTFSMTVQGTKTLSGGPTDANGQIRSAFNRNLPAGCSPALITYAPSATENLYLGSSYNFFFYTSGNGGPQNCTFSGAGSAGYDVNCDGSVNSVDSLYILQVVAGLSGFASCENVANVNDDNVIDVLDALTLLQYSAGLTS